jgi:hypothetical protein
MGEFEDGGWRNSRMEDRGSRMGVSVATQLRGLDPYGRRLQPSGHVGCATIAIASLRLASGFSPGFPNDATSADVRTNAAPGGRREDGGWRIEDG